MRDVNIKKIFKRYRRDLGVQLLEDAFLKLEGMADSESASLEKISVLKSKIINSTITRINIVERRKRIFYLVYGSLFGLLLGTSFVFFQSFKISETNLSLRTELLQILGDGLEEQYQKSFTSLQSNLEKKIDDDFNKVHVSLTERLKKETQQIRKDIAKNQKANNFR